MNDYDEYVKKYATLYDVAIEEAKGHAMVQIVKNYYENKDKV